MTCDAVHTCCSGSPIVTKWCCDQECEGGARCNHHNKNVRWMRFIAKERGCCCNLSVALHWKCDSPWTRCAWRATHKYMWCKQAIIEWSCREVSIVACCHSVKLCVLAARPFGLQHKKYTSLSFACLIHENDQRWTYTRIWI